MLDDFGEVHHGGRMQGGVPGSNPFQKPIGYRPPSNFNILLPTDSNTSIVRAQMASNGILYILSNYTNYVDISSLRYSIY
jgi:hypothetical protein